MDKLKNKLKQSETRVVMRSEINPTDYNPRKITAEARKALKANMKTNGIIGGLVWNEETGNLVSGHQRISIADEINKYDEESKANDYEVKLEVVSVDEKKEKEMNLFFNSKAAQGQFDYGKLALIVPSIDVNLAGLDEVDLSMIEVELPSAIDYEVPDFAPQIEKKIEKELEKHEESNTEPKGEETESTELSDEEKKAHVKAIKEKVKEGAVYEGEPYFTVSFDSYENKAFFLERFGISAETRYVKGEELADKMDEIV